MLNRVVLIGRLTRDPELRFLADGTAVCNFTLAVDRPFAKEGQRQADFINCQVWKKQAEASAKYLAKGKLAAVDGRISIRSFENKEGQKQWATEVVAENVRFLSPKDAGSGPAESKDDFISHEIDEDPDALPF